MRITSLLVSSAAALVLHRSADMAGQMAPVRPSAPTLDDNGAALPPTASRPERRRATALTRKHQRKGRA